MAPPNAASYANLMRSVAIGNQQRLAEVLDAGVTSSDSACAADSQAGNTTAGTCAGRVWAKVSGSSLSLGGPQGLDSNAYGLLVGADGTLGDAFHLGVEAGAGQIRTENEPGQNSRVNNVHAGVYAFAKLNPWVVSATLDFLHSSYHAYRETGIGLAGANPDGRTLSAGLQVAWPITVAQGSLTPKVGMLYQHQQLGNFNEDVASGNPLASAFGVDGLRSTATSLQPYAAVAYAGSIQAGTVTWVPKVELGYRYQLHGDTPAVNLTAQDGTTFLIPGTDVGRSMGTVDARVTALLGGSWSVYVGYQGLFANHLHLNSLTAGFSKRF